MSVKLFVAIPTEFPEELCPPEVEIIYTGVGKINAAIAAMKHLQGADRSVTVRYDVKLFWAWCVLCLCR